MSQRLLGLFASPVTIPQTIAGSISAPVPFSFPRSRGSWCMKGTNESSFSRWGLVVPLTHSGLSDVGSFWSASSKRNVPSENREHLKFWSDIVLQGKSPSEHCALHAYSFFFFFFVSLVTTCWSFLKYCSFSKASLISVLLAAFIVFCTVELHNLVCSIMGMYSWGVMKFNKFGLSLCGFQIFPGVGHWGCIFTKTQSNAATIIYGVVRFRLTHVQRD